MDSLAYGTSCDEGSSPLASGPHPPDPHPQTCHHQLGWNFSFICEALNLKPVAGVAQLPSDFSENRHKILNPLGMTGLVFICSDLYVITRTRIGKKMVIHLASKQMAFRRTTALITLKVHTCKSQSDRDVSFGGAQPEHAEKLVSICLTSCRQTGQSGIKVTPSHQ